MGFDDARIVVTVNADRFRLQGTDIVFYGKKLELKNVTAWSPRSLTFQIGKVSGVSASGSTLVLVINSQAYKMPLADVVYLYDEERWLIYYSVSAINIVLEFYPNVYLYPGAAVQQSDYVVLMSGQTHQVADKLRKELVENFQRSGSFMVLKVDSCLLFRYENQQTRQQQQPKEVVFFYKSTNDYLRAENIKTIYQKNGPLTWHNPKP